MFNIVRMKNLIESLIKKFGTAKETAKELGVSPQVVTNWRNRGMSSKAIVKLLHQRPELFQQPQPQGKDVAHG
jgi:DNA invertase Pin-like site-specific DNA recombinase